MKSPAVLTGSLLTNKIYGKALLYAMHEMMYHLRPVILGLFFFFVVRGTLMYVLSTMPVRAGIFDTNKQLKKIKLKIFLSFQKEMRVCCLQFRYELNLCVRSAKLKFLTTHIFCCKV